MEKNIYENKLPIPIRKKEGESKAFLFLSIWKEIGIMIEYCKFEK